MNDIKYNYLYILIKEKNKWIVKYNSTETKFEQ
jgi:hypothetical protein